MAIDRSVYEAIRTNVGLFDATNYYGRIFLRGKDAIDLLNRMSSNDLTPLEKGGGVVRTALLNEKGRFVDLLTVVKGESGNTLIFCGKDKEQVIISWLDKFTIMEDARFEKATDKVSQFVVWGPKAKELLKLRNSQSPVNSEIDATPISIVRDTSERLNILVLASGQNAIWKKLEEATLSASGEVIDAEMFELLRIESGIPINPNEINDKHNPLELPISHEFISFTKGCYIGQEVIARLDAQNKVQRMLVGLRFPNLLPWRGDRILDESLSPITPLGNEIGEVTSVAQSPQSGNIGLGYVRGKYVNPGTEISVKSSEGNILPATIVQLPFHA